MIGLLSETIGSPTPMQIPFRPALQLPKADLLAPIPPQAWHFRQSVDYSVTANKAVLDYASRHREQLALQHLAHGASGDRARQPRSLDDHAENRRRRQGRRRQGNQGAQTGVKEFERFFRDPARRDPRGYVIPVAQPDFLTATKFVNILLGTGVQVHRAKADFEIKGKKYAKGSYVVKGAQAFRAHVLDMFEPQDHPNDFKYPGAPPTAAVRHGRLDAGVSNGGAVRSHSRRLRRPVRGVARSGRAAAGASGGWQRRGRLFLEHEDQRFVPGRQSALESRRRGAPLAEAVRIGTARSCRPATFFIPRKATTLPRLQKIAAELGTRFVGSEGTPGNEAKTLRPVRVGLWDRHGGSMPSGWTRWLLERFEFPFRVVFTPEIEEGNLREKFDVLILVDGAILTNTTAELRKFVDAGGTILAIGSSTTLRRSFGLPIDHYLAVKGEVLPPEKFYIPPSLLRIRIDAADPLAWGMPEEADVMFTNSPTFRLPEDAVKKGLRRVAWFDYEDAAAQRLGVGPRASGRGRRDRRGAGRPLANSSCSARRSCSALSRTGRSSFSSTASCRREQGNEEGLRNLASPCCAHALQWKIPDSHLLGFEGPLRTIA